MDSNIDNKPVVETLDEKSPLVKESVDKYNQMEANKELQVKVHEGVDEAEQQSAIITEKVEELTDGTAKKPQCKRLQCLMTRIRNFIKSICCW